jgi:DNA polymerase III delta subunit
MSSKSKSFLPWMYLSELSDDFVSAPGLYGFSCADPYVSKIISNHLFKNKTFQVKTADEITLEWFEDTVGGYDLFAAEQCFKIMNGDELKNIQFLVDDRIDWGENTLFIHFKNDKKVFKTLSENNPHNFFKVSAPKPWQANKLIEFYLKSMGLSLDRSIVDYLAEALPNDSSLYMNAIKTLFLHVQPGKPIDMKLVKELISSHKLDFFNLADIWVSGNRTQFFKGLLPLSSYEDLMRLSIFMQGHLIKLIDPSYQEDKKNLSQYDRKITQNSQRKTKEEWEKDLRLFAELEILSKQKSSQVESFIKNRSV